MTAFTAVKKGSAIARNKVENTNESIHMVAYEATRTFEYMLYLIDKNHNDSEKIINKINHVLETDEA